MTARPQLEDLNRRYLSLTLLVSVSIVLPFALLSFSEIFNRVMPMNDVLLYGWWLQLMQQGQQVFGLAQPFVYPYVSLLPMWLALFLGGPAGILVGWCSLVAILNTVAIGFLTNWGRAGNRNFMAAWFWLGYLALLGPSGVGRIDAIAAALAVIGVVAFAKDRLFTAVTLFTFGAWIKIWPFALVISAFIADKQKRLVSYAFATVLSAVFLFAFFMGANAHVLSFVFTQGDRGIQIESPIATIWLWFAKLGIGHAGIYFDKEIITNQIFGDLVDLFSKLMTPVMFGALAITVWLGYRAFKVGAKRNSIFATLGLTAVLDLIVFNKVGSPQFMCWIAVPVIAWIYFGQKISFFPAIAVSLIALLTNLVYPVFYLDLMGLGNTSMILLTARNLLLIGLLVWSNLQLAKLSKPLGV
jgi:hypothetical protein